MNEKLWYHAHLLMGKGEHYWANYTKDGIISSLLVPFIEGQVIKIRLRDKPALLNLSGSLYLKIFKSPKKVKIEEIRKGIKDETFKGEECTEELINEIRLTKTRKGTKSLIQKLFLPIKKQIFVIMKLNDTHLDSAYKGVIRPLGEEFGYRVIRIDDIQDSGKITDQVLDFIVESEIVLADLSFERPNCYYETGFAHAIGRELIFTIRKDEPKHFDVSGHRFIEWQTEHELRMALRARLETIVSNK